LSIRPAPICPSTLSMGLLRPCAFQPGLCFGFTCLRLGKGGGMSQRIGNGGIQITALMRALRPHRGCRQ
jgi:hypothetical protein